MKKRFFALSFILVTGFGVCAQTSEEVAESEVTALPSVVTESVISPASTPAKTVNWFTVKPEFSLLGQAVITNYHDFVQYTLGLDIILEADMKELVSKAGVRFDFRKFDYTYQGFYAPTLWGKFNPGITMIHHLSFYYDQYLEYDLLIGPHIAYKPFNWFDFSLDFLYQHKSAMIYAIKDEVPFVLSNCPAFDLTFNFHLIPELSIDFTIASYNFFKYHLFFAPNVTLGLKYRANKHYEARLYAEIQYVDMFTLSANLNRFTTGASVCWRF